MKCSLFLLCCFVSPNIMSIICIVVWTPEHRYRSAQFEGKPRPFISLFVRCGNDFKIRSALIQNLLILKVLIHFMTVPQSRFIHLLIYEFWSQTEQETLLPMRSSVSCALFSSKTQDVYTYYFACISVQFLFSKEHVLQFTTLILFYFCQHFSFYFSALRHRISCMFTGGNEWIRGSSPRKDNSNTTVAILI